VQAGAGGEAKPGHDEEPGLLNTFRQMVQQPENIVIATAIAVIGTFIIYSTLSRTAVLKNY